MNMQLEKILSILGTELEISQTTQHREAFFLGINDGSDQGPELSMGFTFDEKDVQNAYDVGTYIGASIWAAKGKE